MILRLLFGVLLCVSLPAADAQPWTNAQWNEDLSDQGLKPVLTTNFTLHGSELTVSIPRTGVPVGRPQILNWIGAAANRLALFYGRFPVPQLTIEISNEGTERVHNGVTWNGRLIEIALGSATTVADLDQDWVMTHEMIHLSFPDLPAQHLWMEEGLATYLEPLLRVRSNTISAATMWIELVDSLPEGQPTKGYSLDEDHSWGRTYWGGAGYWLQADLLIRDRTAGRHSIATVLRAVLNAGGDGSESWSLERVFATARQASGVDVLAELHREQGLKAKRVDWDAWWLKLGVRRSRSGVTFVPDAPWAAVRDDLTR